MSVSLRASPVMSLSRAFSVRDTSASWPGYSGRTNHSVDSAALGVAANPTTTETTRAPLWIQFATLMVTRGSYRGPPREATYSSRSSSVLGQSSWSNFESARSASRRPAFWQRGQ